MFLYYVHMQCTKLRKKQPKGKVTKCGDCRHTQQRTNMRAPHKHTRPDSMTGGNGLAKLNKRNHRDLNGRQSRSDVLKCALLFSLPFSINLSLLPLSHLVSLPGSPPNPTAAPPPFCFLLTTVSFSTFAFPSLRRPLMYLFFCFLLFCVCSFFSLIHV